MNFVDWTFNNKHTVKVPDFEVEFLQSKIHPQRLESMEKLLKNGDTYFDIGTEHGWFAPIFARWVGAENMCLFEPQPLSWPNIRATWEENVGKIMPKSAYYGFVGDRIQRDDVHQPLGRWPVQTEMDFQLRPGYCGLNERRDIPATTLDAWVEKTGVVPDAIGMNIEGAEAVVLAGGQGVFKKYHPLVWVGMHVYDQDKSPIEYDYGTTCDNLLQLMYDCGYKTELLGQSFERWYLFYK